MALGLIPLICYFATRSPYYQQRPTLGREPVGDLSEPVPPSDLPA